MTEHRCTLMLVDDDTHIVRALGHLLADLGRLVFATRGQAALAQMQHDKPDLVLLDLSLPDMSGFDVCQQMKADPTLADIPVLFLTSHDSPELELRGLELGAVDFIAKPPRGPMVRARVRTHLRMKLMADALRRAADTDGLTGIANRRSFDEALPLEWRRAQRHGQSLALLLVDIDHFKAYNDHDGHPAGDDCLRDVARALAATARRPADLVARYGGEEFALLLPATDRAGALEVAAAVIQAVDALQRPHAALGAGATVSVSVGVAAWVPRATATAAVAGSPGAAALAEMPDADAGREAASLVLAADRALYAAKAAGRRRACAAPEATCPDAAHPPMPRPVKGDAVPTQPPPRPRTAADA